MRRTVRFGVALFWGRSPVGVTGPVDRFPEPVQGGTTGYRGALLPVETMAVDTG